MRYVLYIRYVSSSRSLYLIRSIPRDLGYHSSSHSSTGSILDRTYINQLASSDSSLSSRNIVLKLSVTLILQFYILFSLSKGISFRILPTRVVYNRKEELGEYFSLPGLLTGKLLYCYKILKGFIISINFNPRVYTSKLYALLG